MVDARARIWKENKCFKPRKADNPTTVTGRDRCKWCRCEPLGGFRTEVEQM